MGGLLLKLDHEGVTDQIAEFKDKGVANLVVNADPLLLPRDNVGLGQNFEVFGNVGLAQPGRLNNFSHVPWPCFERTDNLEPTVFGQHLKKALQG